MGFASSPCRCRWDLLSAFQSSRQIIEAERQRQGLEVAVFAQQYDLPLPALENLLNEAIQPNPILLDCATHIADQ